MVAELHNFRHVWSTWTCLLQVRAKRELVCAGMVRRLHLHNMGIGGVLDRHVVRAVLDRGTAAAIHQQHEKPKRRGPLSMVPSPVARGELILPSTDAPEFILPLLKLASQLHLTAIAPSLHVLNVAEGLIQNLFLFFP